MLYTIRCLIFFNGTGLQLYRELFVHNVDYLRCKLNIHSFLYRVFKKKVNWGIKK